MRVEYETVQEKEKLFVPIFSFFIHTTMSIVTLFVDTSDEQVSSERRFDKSLTISQLKVRLST